MSPLPSRMDLAPAPGAKDSPLKSPVVEVEALDMVSAEVPGADNAENPVAISEEPSQSESETDNDMSGEEWETESLYEDAIQFVRDEQLRDGGMYSILTVLALEWPWLTR